VYMILVGKRSGKRLLLRLKIIFGVTLRWILLLGKGVVM